MKLNRRAVTGLIAITLAGANHAAAQDFSGKPIRMLVGLAAGGATDVMARIVAQKMSEGLHTTVLVENKAGGNFIPAVRELTGSAPDGHTLFFISTSTLITQPLHPDYPFDLTKLTPITQVATNQGGRVAVPLTCDVDQVCARTQVTCHAGWPFVAATVRMSWPASTLRLRPLVP